MQQHRPEHDLLVYLAEPIDFGEADISWVDYTKGWLHGVEVNTFKPKDGWNAHTPDARVSTINNVALNAADAVVAFLPDVKTVGVPAEISHALAKRTPVLVVTDHERSFVVEGWRFDPLVQVVGFDRPALETGLAWLIENSIDQRRVRQTAEKFNLPYAKDRSPLVFEPVADTRPEAPEGSSSKLPTRGYLDDAGFDLYTSTSVKIPAGGFVDVPCGVKVDLPEGYWGFITGRSSTLRKHGLLVSTGIIDTGYTGPLFAGVKNLNNHEYEVAQGDRLAQLIPLPAVAPQFRAVFGIVREKERGDRGFGSTGV